jgi:hypothetical protein
MLLLAGIHAVALVCCPLFADVDDFNVAVIVVVLAVRILRGSRTATRTFLQRAF